MKKLLLTLVFISVVVLSGCWGGGKYKGTQYTAIKDIPAGKALVYIYRPYKFAGSALHYKINNLDTRICDIGLYNDSYIVYYADPGQCEFWTLKRENNKHKAMFEAKAGETYYIQCKYDQLTLVDKEKAKEKIKKCQLIDECSPLQH